MTGPDVPVLLGCGRWQHLARDFYGFLRNWLSVFKDKAHLDIWIFGESYAGEQPYDQKHSLLADS